jgi:hypothetical protein
MSHHVQQLAMSVAPLAGDCQVQVRALVPETGAEGAKQQQLRQTLLTAAIAAPVLVVPAGSTTSLEALAPSCNSLFSGP